MGQQPVGTIRLGHLKHVLEKMCKDVHAFKWMALGANNLNKDIRRGAVRLDGLVVLLGEDSEAIALPPEDKKESSSIKSTIGSNTTDEELAVLQSKR